MYSNKYAAAILASLMMAGCCAPASREAEAVKTPPTPLTEHFIPAPAIPVPRPPTAEEMFGQASNSGFSGPAAQTFTATETGVLSEIDLGSQRQQLARDAAPSEPLIIEIRSTRDDLPAMGSDPVRFRGSVAYNLLPQAARLTGGMIRLDLTAQHVHVEKGERLAIVQYYDNEKNPVQFQTVFGQPYKDGNLFHIEQDQWKPLGAVGELQFRVYVMRGTGGGTPPPKVDTTAAVSIPVLPANQMPVGTLVAQCLPIERPPTTQQAIPSVTGRWQFRAHVFNDQGSYYLELIAYNGTNQRGSSYPQSNRPQSITLTRVGDTSGKVVFPTHTNGMNNYRDMQQQQMPPESGEGSVHEYKLADATEPLPAGEYVVSIVPPANESTESVSVSFKVP